MGEKSTMRFAFAIEGGRDPGLCLGGWRVFISGNDIMISAKSMKPMKVTLHDETRSSAARPWRFAYTTEHMQGPKPMWPPDRDRAVYKFSPTPFVDGIRRTFAIAVPRGGLRNTLISPKETTIIVPDRWDMLGVAMVLTTEPGVEPNLWNPAQRDPLKLTNGRRVWLACVHQPVEATDPERPPDNNLIRVLSPENDEVSCPGFIVPGLNIG